MTGRQSANAASGAAPLRGDGELVLGAALVVSSSAMFAVGGAAAKFLSASLDPTALLIWRNLASTAGIAIWYLFWRDKSLWSERVGIHILRGFATFAGLWTYFKAIETIPLATAVLLRTASPVFVPVVAYLLYRRPSDRNVWIGAWIGLVGVALVIEPNLVGASLGAASGVASGMLGAIGAVLMWRLGGTESPRLQLAWLTIVLTICSIFVAPWSLRMPASLDWPVIAVIAAATTLSQLFLVHAFAIAPADKIITWGYVSVVFSALAGVAFWDEKLAGLAIAGMCIIVAGSHLATRRRKAAAVAPLSAR